ncbi:MAG: hypothetical protein ABR508_11495 [Candidatus Baltobacteraceae bacterium]
MSGIDPAIAVALSAAVSAADTAFLESALTIAGASAEVLQAQIAPGDVLAAAILPPQNGQDRIEVLGQTVLAQLPPDVRPGETILLQVTGFQANRILVRNLGLLDPQNPPPQPSTAPPSRDVFSAASLRAPAPASAPLPQAPPLFRSVVDTHLIDARIAAAQTPQRAAPPARALPPRAPQSVPPIVQSLPPPAAQPLRTVSDLLRAVRLPDTAFTRTAAAIAHQAPQRLAPVLARLDAALASVPGDARAATLRTLIGFTAGLNLKSEETLPAQIAACVSHLVEGAEAKTAQLLRALAQADAAQAAFQDEPPPAASAAPGAARNAAAQNGPPIQNAPVLNLHTASANVPAAAQGHVLERLAASEHDLKTLILSLLRDPPGARMPSLSQALNESLITITAAQVNTAAANVQTPGTLTFAVPAFFHDGGKPAYLRISRDANGARTPMDADNFHVAFVLDTANLGTVAIDVQTAARTVKVDVKTEAVKAASAFSGTLPALRERLEHLRYRVASASAAVLQQATAPVAAAPGRGAPRPGSPAANVDTQA